MNTPAQPKWRQGRTVALHYDIHATPADLDLGRDLSVDDLVEAWGRVKPDWIQCDSKGTPGYASYPSRVGTPAPNLAGDPLRTYREATRRLGLPLVAHYCAVLNQLEASRRPDWVRYDHNDQPSTQCMCITGGYASELVVPQLLEILDDYDVDGFWVDGDIWLAAPCYCQRCQGLYRDATAAASVPRSRAEAGWEQWLAFHRRMYLAYVASYTDAIHAHKPACVVTDNWAYASLQPDPIEIAVDSLSGDTAFVHTIDQAEVEARILDRRGLPWDMFQWSMAVLGGHADYDYRSRDSICQEAAVALASGGAAGMYLLPRRNGGLVAWQNDLMREVVEFCHARTEVSIGSQSIPQAAVLHTAASFYARDVTTPGGHEVALYPFGEAIAAVRGATLGLLDLGLHVDVITDELLQADAQSYALIVVPDPVALSPGVVEQLRRYVERGGRLLLSGTDIVRLAPGLTGLAEEYGIDANFRWIGVGGEAACIPGPWALTACTEASVLAPLLRQQDPELDRTENPAIALLRLGEGRVATIPAQFFTAMYDNRQRRRRAVLADLCTALDPSFKVRLDGPPTVRISYRSSGSRLLVHLLNIGSDVPLSPRKVDVEHVPVAGPIEVRLELDAEPASVRMAPEGDCSYAWNQGTLTVTVPRLHIHSVVVIEPHLAATAGAPTARS